MPTDEEDLWGRLNSLRAEASHKLHHEVELSNGALPLQAQPEPIHSAGMPIDTPAKIEVAAEPATTEDIKDLAGLTKSESDPQPDLGGPTTLFDRPLETGNRSGEHVEPESFVEKYKHLLDEDGADGSDPIATPPAPVVASPTAEAANNDDEDIEDYMAKMMARLRGESGASIFVSKPAKTVEPQAVEPTPKAAALTATANESAASEPKLASLDELKKAPKPEQNTNMSALRDLANDSAQQAITIANVRSGRERAFGNLLLSLLTGGSGTYLVWASRGELGISLFGGAAAVAAGSYWACRAFQFLAAHSSKRHARVDEFAAALKVPNTGTEPPMESTGELETPRCDDIVPFTDVVLDSEEVEHAPQAP